MIIVLLVLLGILGVWLFGATLMFMFATPGMSLLGKLQVSLMWPMFLFVMLRFWR